MLEEATISHAIISETLTNNVTLAQGSLGGTPQTLLTTDILDIGTYIVTGGTCAYLASEGMTLDFYFKKGTATFTAAAKPSCGMLSVAGGDILDGALGGIIRITKMGTLLFVVDSVSTMVNSSSVIIADGFGYTDNVATPGKTGFVLLRHGN